MQDLRGTYVHRGDVERRRRFTRRAFLFAGLIVSANYAVRSLLPVPARAESVSIGTATGMSDAHLKVAAALHTSHDELRLAGAQIERLNSILNYARRFQIPSEMSAAVFDAATAEHLDPDLAFPLVRLESRFDAQATSPVGAIGLTQLMPATARFYVPNATRDSLYARDLNLRVGFRYLHDLIKQNAGSVSVALLIYNRGPDAVAESISQGLDPSNGYDRLLLRRYRGKGVLD